MGRFVRASLAAVALAAVALGCALITGFGLGSAQAAQCTPSPVTDKMNATVSPSSDVKAFQRLKASFSGSISDGHCAGDSFSFAIPKTLTAQDGATYQLKSPTGAVVATMVISGRKATVTLTNFVETHIKVTLMGFFDARIDGSTAPGGTDNIVFDINGTSTTPVHFAPCPGCTSAPSKTVKAGSLNGSQLSMSIYTVRSTAANEVFSFTDTLTSPGQEFGCPTTATAGFYKSRDAAGNPIYTKRGVPVTITSCSTSVLQGTVTIPTSATSARIVFKVNVTDPNLSSYSDTATVITNGTQQSASTNVERFGGGGSGNGTNLSASPSITNRTSTSPTRGGESRALASTTARNFPTAVNGGVGAPPAGGGDGGSRLTGALFIVAGLGGLGLIGWLTLRRRPKGRYAS